MMQSQDGHGKSEGDKPSSDGPGQNELHHHHFFNQLLWVLLLFLTACLVGLLVYRIVFPLKFFHDSQSAKKDLELERALMKASTADKTVIITTLNDAWAAPNSMFDLFLESIREGNRTEKLLRHMVIVALDKKAYAHCTDLHLHCYELKTEGIDFSGDAHFMSNYYVKLMWRRICWARKRAERAAGGHDTWIVIPENQEIWRQ